MNDTEQAARHAEAERIRALIVKLNEHEIERIPRMVMDATTAARMAGIRLGEASLLRAIGEIDDDAMAAAREAWRTARDHVEAVQLQVRAVPALRQRLTSELEPLLTPDKAAERERRVQRYQEVRAAFEREFADMAEEDVIANGRTLYDAACGVGRGREIKDYFHGMRNRRFGASLQRFV